MSHLFLALSIHVFSARQRAIGHLHQRFDEAQHRRHSGDCGQATTEYALILLAAAMVGLLVIAWASAGGGAAKISRLFNGVIDAVIDRV